MQSTWNRNRPSLGLCCRIWNEQEKIFSLSISVEACSVRLCAWASVVFVFVQISYVYFVNARFYDNTSWHFELVKLNRIFTFSKCGRFKRIEQLKQFSIRNQIFLAYWWLFFESASQFGRWTWFCHWRHRISVLEMR